jgi:2-oxoglutarate dehydrogenase E2 component (dihydrolipoamide succinyltransferase)
MRKSSRTLCAAAAIVAVTASVPGCRSFEANVPGVLDLRSDGSAAAPATDKLAPNPETTREGVGGILTGNGVQANGADVTIEDRHWWFIGLLKIINPSMKEEMAAALGKGAMKNVHVGEQEAFVDAGITIGMTVVSGIIPFIGWGLLLPITQALTPPMTGTFSGTRIATAGGSMEGTPPPVEPAPPAAPAPAPDAAAPAPAPATGGKP